MEVHINSESNRSALVEEYQSFVHLVVGRLIGTLRLPKDQFDEFVSAGNLGLVEAASRFDFSQGVDFKSYAFLRIRGAIIDSIRECSDLSGKAYRCAKALQIANDLRETIAESPQGFGDTPEEKLQEFLDLAAKGALAFRLSYQDAEVEITELIAEGQDPETQLELDGERKRLNDLVESLPEKERQVIKELYFSDKTITEMANASGTMTKSWVSRLHARALNILKEKYVESLQIEAKQVG